MITNPKLLFMANDLKNKGRSNKSYTIKLVNDQYNDEHLDQIFSSKANRTVLFDCTYDIDNLTMQGILKVTKIVKAYAEATFISGNGKLWESLSNQNLRDYDFSALNHTLTDTNVLASETKGDYIYDICDRGRLLEDATYEEATKSHTGDIITLAKLDITERYPAINIKTIFETIMNEEGYGITWAENLNVSDLDEVYLMYMEDNNIRNSKEWEKSALFAADGVGEVHSTTQSGAPALVYNVTGWFPDERYDNGNNFTGAANDNVGSNLYTIPEDGTYSFECNIKLTFQISGATINSDTISVGIYNETTSTWVWRRDYDSSDLSAGQLTVNANTHPTEFTASDQLSVKVIWDVGTSTYPFTLTITQGTTAEFFNTVSRYYGAGSTVEVSTLMPDMKALDFVSMVCNYMNFYTFYREELKVLEIEHGRDDKPTVGDSITPQQITEVAVAKSNYMLKFSTDKAAPLEDIYVDNGGQYEDALNFKFSRTLMNDFVRLFADIRALVPVLWNESNPLAWENVIDPPKWVTKGNYRLMRYTGNDTSYSYTLTYGGDSADDEDTISTYPVFEELDIEAFHRYEITVMEQSEINFVNPIDTNRLYNQDFFKAPIWVDGYGKYWIEQAKQVRGNIYNIKGIK